MSEKKIPSRSSRRRFLKAGARASAALLGAPAILSLPMRPARAASNVVRIMGVSTVALPDWGALEKETGLRIQFTPIADAIGIFLHEVEANDAGDRYDLFAAFSGPWQTLAKKNYLAKLDASRLSNWAGVAQSVKTSPLIGGGEGALWSVPLVMNADSFAYFPAALRLPRAPEPLSWGLLFDDRRTRGMVALDDSFFTLQHAATYLKFNKLATIGNPGNLSASEANTVANFLIERKKAGQFRTLGTSFDEQVALLVNGEVVAETAWEPAVKEARAQGSDVEYAWTIEGYDKWMINAFIPRQVEARGNTEQVYKVIDWLLGGNYAAQTAILRGYLGARPDLGLAFAKAHQWEPARLEQINSTIAKMDKKFSHPLFWNSGWPDQIAACEREMARFKNA